MGEYVSNLCRNCGDKTDSSKSCTEFIIAFVAVSFLKVFILIVKYNLRMGAGGQRSSHLWKIRDRCCTAPFRK